MQVDEKMEWTIVCAAYISFVGCQPSISAIFPVDFKTEGDIIDDVSLRIRGPIRS